MLSPKSSNVVRQMEIPGAEPGSEAHSPPRGDNRPNATTGGRGGSQLRLHWRNGIYLQFLL